MLGSRKVIVDSFCEVGEFTKHIEDQRFYSFDNHTIEKDAVYIISRQLFTNSVELIKQLATDNVIFPILGNPAEGSDTMLKQIRALGIVDLVKQRKIGIIAGGYLEPEIPHLYHENFLPKILDYKENLNAMSTYWSQYQTARPYKFLFLNGRARRHRHTLLQRLQGLLPQAIWSNLDESLGDPIKLLDSKYEYKTYQTNTTKSFSGFAKHNLFDNEWGEIYLTPAPYLDTYFSLVTETVFDYPYSFRTEKIWKPIAMGHPFIVAANAGYYRDLQNIGFRTFGHIIDETFDQIDNNADRLTRIAQVVEDLCQQDLAKFLDECYTVCKYNQQHLAEMQLQVRKEFPDRLTNFIQSIINE